MQYSNHIIHEQQQQQHSPGNEVFGATAGTLNPIPSVASAECFFPNLSQPQQQQLLKLSPAADTTTTDVLSSSSSSLPYNWRELHSLKPTGSGVSTYFQSTNSTCDPALSGTSGSVDSNSPPATAETRPRYSVDTLDTRNIKSTSSVGVQESSQHNHYLQHALHRSHHAREGEVDSSSVTPGTTATTETARGASSLSRDSQSVLDEDYTTTSTTLSAAACGSVLVMETAQPAENANTLTGGEENSHATTTTTTHLPSQTSMMGGLADGHNPGTNANTAITATVPTMRHGDDTVDEVLGKIRAQVSVEDDDESEGEEMEEEEEGEEEGISKPQEQRRQQQQQPYVYYDEENDDDDEEGGAEVEEMNYRPPQRRPADRECRSESIRNISAAAAATLPQFSTPVQEPPIKHPHHDIMTEVAQNAEAVEESGFEANRSREQVAGAVSTLDTAAAVGRKAEGNKISSTVADSRTEHGQCRVHDDDDDDDDDDHRNSESRNYGIAPVDPSAHVVPLAEEEKKKKVNRGIGETAVNDLPNIKLATCTFANTAITYFVMSLCRENASEPLLSSVFHSHCLPMMSVKNYMERIVRYCGCSGEALLCGLLLLLKYSVHSGHPVTLYSAHRLLITGIVLGIKLRDDAYYSNVYYGRIGGISGTELNKLELFFIDQLGWAMSTPSLEYAEMVKVLETLTAPLDVDVLDAYAQSHPAEVAAAFHANVAKKTAAAPAEKTAASVAASEDDGVSETTTVTSEMTALEAASRRAMEVAFRQHQWRTVGLPWMMRLRSDTLERQSERGRIEQDAWRTEEAKWGRYRAEEAAAALNASQRSSSGGGSRWMSPLTVEHLSAGGSTSNTQDWERHNSCFTRDMAATSGGAHMSEQPRYANYAVHGQQLQQQNSSSSRNFYGIGRRNVSGTSNSSYASAKGGDGVSPSNSSGQQQQQQHFDSNSNAATTATTTTPSGSHINVNAKPYFYVSSSSKRKAAAAAAAATASAPSVAVDGSSSSTTAQGRSSSRQGGLSNAAANAFPSFPAYYHTSGMPAQQQQPAENSISGSGSIKEETVMVVRDGAYVSRHDRRGMEMMYGASASSHANTSSNASNAGKKRRKPASYNDY